MFFVFGSPRSGTTLLAQCLNAHPDLVLPDETDFIIPTAFIFDRLAEPAVRRSVLKKLIVHSARFRFSLKEYLSETEVEDIVENNADRADRLFEALYAAIANRAGALLAGDKSPNDLLFLRMLIKVGGISPAAKIIHIVRDVRDVVHSIRGTDFTNTPEAWFPRLWSASNVYLWDLFHGSAQYRMVRYEDFVRAPESTVQSLCGHLGVAYQSSQLDPGRRHPRYRAAAHHRKLYEPISDRNVGAYRSEMPAAIIARCEEHAAEGIRVFGY